MICSSRFMGGVALLAFASTAACSSASTEGAPVDPAGSTASAEAIPQSDNPYEIVPGASLRLSDVVSEADIGRTFTVPEANIPYADTYWPFVDNGIDARWEGGNTYSPLEKYMAVTDPGATSSAKSWERANHGVDVPGVASWFGHCPGWTGAAIYNRPVTHSVSVAPDGQGGFAPCTGGASCVRFEVGDINALQAEAFVNAPSKFIGSRCDTSPNAVNRGRDRYGRIQEGCKGLNPGALLVVASNQIRRKGQAFAINAQGQTTTDQIWNQPAFGYSVQGFQRIDEKAAIQLVARNSRTRFFTFTPRSYKWNDAAQAFALVDMTIIWAKEAAPGTHAVLGTQTAQYMPMRAIIELDGNDQIIGGEYLDAPKHAGDSVDYNRLTVPPFVWIPEGTGPDGNTGGDGHNPYVRSALVQKLVALGQ